MSNPAEYELQALGVVPGELTISETRHNFGSAQIPRDSDLAVTGDNPLAGSLTRAMNKTWGTTVTYVDIGNREYRVFLKGKKGNGGVYAREIYDPEGTAQEYKVCTELKDLDRGLALLTARLSSQQSQTRTQ